jgi:LEA14-like dessication related protein
VLTRRSFLPALPLLLSLGLATSACSKPEPPTLVPKEVKLTALGPTGANVLLRVEATNPNRVALSVRSVTGKAKLDDKWALGTVTIANPVVLPPHAPTMVDVPMTLPWSDLNALTALAAKTGPVPYVVDGTVSVGGEHLNVDLPFSISGTITREQILGAALKSLPVIPGLTAPPSP